MQDRQAEAILLTLIEEGPKALAEPRNYAVRANLMWCATQALNGLIGCGVPQDWATHMIGHELTALYGIDHAQSLAIVLPGVLRHQRDRKRAKLLQFAERVWDNVGGTRRVPPSVTATDEDARADQAIDRMDQFFRSLGVGTRLADYNIPADAPDVVAARLAKRGMKLGEHGDLGEKEIREILDVATMTVRYGYCPEGASVRPAQGNALGTGDGGETCGRSNGPTIRGEPLARWAVTTPAPYTSPGRCPGLAEPRPSARRMTMEPIVIRNAYYVKLGRGGKWADDSLSKGMIRIGWRNQTVDDINNWREAAIRETEIRSREKDGSPTAKSAVANDVSAPSKIVHSTPEDVWITFHGPYLWWCRVGKDGIEQDAISKYRTAGGRWSNCDIEGNRLIINQLPGRLSMKQRFSGTICGFDEDQLDDLHRLLNNQPSEDFLAVSRAKATLTKQVEGGLSLLHWKDFEILVDLVFRNAGWRRGSCVGETMKSVDMELEEPITGYRYQVQVKSDATIADFTKYADEFDGNDFEKLYFVAHNSKEKWANAPKYDNVELILQERLAEMVVDFGLVNWLLKKIR